MTWAGLGRRHTAGVSSGNCDRQHLFPETHQAAVMSNSQEQSLDENGVFLPMNESSPEFLHCEKERQAVERLLNAGPEAFYSSVGTERSGCFLSSEEVNQITSWAQDYRFKPLQVQRQENGEEVSSETEDFGSTYFPSHSDTPTPDLELGWPEKGPWVPKGGVTVHTSPPAEGEPPVRQIIRRHLQKAGQVCKYDFCAWTKHIFSYGERWSTFWDSILSHHLHFRGKCCTFLLHYHFEILLEKYRIN